MDRAQRILLVDDDPGLLRLLSIRLKSGGYQVAAVESGNEALANLAAVRPDVVITDLRMDGMDGMALFDNIRERHPTLPVIILTAHGSIPDAVEATKRGVFGFLTKPFDSSDLMEQVEKALNLSGGSEEGRDDGRQAPWREEIITRSPLMEDVLGRARMVADSDASVFIQGDSGTGKELMARAVHKASPRAEQPFVAINCGAIPETLLESELFGHKKGAFTGATQDQKGLFQAAHGGTLFLDEIGDMPLTLQVKLLRVLQERLVRPVGATEGISVDVRIITATHRDLAEEMSEGRFREDLYYRLNVVALELPPLADRSEDIPLLATHFLSQLAEKYRKSVKGFAPEAMERLVSAPWPGNVRQLFNVVEQVVTLSPTPIISEDLVQKALNEDPEELPSFADARREFEREYLARVLQMTGGNVSQAARLAKRNRTEFYKLLNRHHLDPTLFKQSARSES
ncbi:sigma 54-interacting transcriptional regulator [Thiohalorhabdus methylotrophus]|uniref:Sigma 54-interacting transcriptional regulator n=1 Tax=Thiohalorhabdus methylotrophus TaxID=3242694 RepID=A0ABV4TZP0_9GAMM